MTGTSDMGSDTLPGPDESVQSAVRGWLLTAAALSEADACRGWRESGIALLRCGGLFTAVRMRAELVHAAARTVNSSQVDRYLADALPDGPVFADRTCRRYYALVPTCAEGEVRWKAHEPYAASLGEGCFLGVPDPAHTTPCRGGSYWCVPIRGPEVLCSVADVEQFLLHGRHLLTAGEAV